MNRTMYSSHMRFLFRILFSFLLNPHFRMIYPTACLLKGNREKSFFIYLGFLPKWSFHKLLLKNGTLKNPFLSSKMKHHQTGTSAFFILPEKSAFRLTGSMDWINSCCNSIELSGHQGRIWTNMFLFKMEKVRCPNIGVYPILSSPA